MPAVYEIPGFYWDEQANKYFKITSNPSGNKYSRGTVTFLERIGKKSKEQEELLLLNSEPGRVQRSYALCNPLTSLGLNSEIGSRRQDVSRDRTAHGADALRRMSTLERPTTSVWYHDHNGATLTTEHRSRSSSGQCKVRFNFEPRSKSSSPHSYSIARIREPYVAWASTSPQSIFGATNTYLYQLWCEDDDQDAFVDEIELSVPHNTIYQLDAESSTYKPSLAVATQEGLFVIGTVAEGSSLPRQLLWRSSPDSHVMDATWLSSDVVIGGLRNGICALYDLRTRDGVNRIAHTSGCSRIQALDGNKLLVAGTRGVMSLYDFRVSRSAAKNASDRTVPYLSYSNFYNDYEMSTLPWAVSKEHNIVATFAEDEGVNVHNLRSGELLRTLKTSKMRRADSGRWFPHTGNSRHLQIMKEAEDERLSGREVGLLVANRDVIERWKF